MGPQKPLEPVHARGMIAMSETVLDPREFAVQISDMVADAVMRKLSVIGLTAENLQKLENLSEAPPLGAPGGGSEAASVADAVLNKLTAIGLTEKNINKLATLGRGTPSLAGSEGSSQQAMIPLHSHDDADSSQIPSSSFTEDLFDSPTWTKSNRQDSLSSLQMSVQGRQKHLVEGGPLLSETRQSVMPSRPAKKLHPFYTHPQRYNTPPIQFSLQRKRAMPQVITREDAMFPRSKKRTRHNEVGCKEYEDTYMGEDLGEESFEYLRADSEVQVDISIY